MASVACPLYYLSNIIQLLASLISKKCNQMLGQNKYTIQAYMLLSYNMYILHTDIMQYAIQYVISYYKLGHFCVSVCVCVCLSVCLSGYKFPHSQRIFSKFGGNIIWVMTRIVGYLLFSERNSRVCAKRARMCALAYFSTDSLQICWEHTTTHHKCQGLHTFHVHVPHACVRARVRERA
jgi:hypothetical protein